MRPFCTPTHILALLPSLLGRSAVLRAEGVPAGHASVAAALSLHAVSQQKVMGDAIGRKVTRGGEGTARAEHW